VDVKNLNLLTFYFDLDSGGISSSNHNNILLQSCVSLPHQLKDLLTRSYHTKSLSSLHIPLELNPWFITGFTDGEGSFSLSVRDIDKDTKKGRVLYVFSIILHEKDEGILKSIQSTSVKIGYQVQLKFVLTQHLRDKELFEYFVKYLGYGYTAVNREGVDFIVTKYSDLKDKLLPLLHLQHPVVGYKYLDYLYFMEAVEIMQKKLHLTEEGLNKLREIQVLMNSGRKNTPSQDTDSATTD
jgi:hypothetical protein